MASPSDIKRDMVTIAKKAGLFGEFDFFPTCGKPDHAFLEGYLSMPIDHDTGKLIADVQRFKLALTLIGRYVFQELKAPSVSIRAGSVVTEHHHVVRTPETFTSTLMQLQPLLTLPDKKSLNFHSFVENEKR